MTPRAGPRTAGAGFLRECRHGAAEICGKLGEVELKAGVEGTELRKLCARFIEAHFVNQLLEDERILREQIDTPLQSSYPIEPEITCVTLPE